MQTLFEWKLHITIKQRQSVLFQIRKLQQLVLVISWVINMLLESHIMLFYMALQLPFMNSRIVRISLVSDVYAVGCICKVILLLEPFLKE